jgi:hypothetical protein
MVKLLDNGANILTQVNLTDAITAGSVLKMAKKWADELTTTTGKTILPTFTTQTEAQEEANHLNIINQLVIGAKEGIVEALTKLVGSDITNAILQTADGSDHKSINNSTLFNVMKVAIDGADRLSRNNVLEQVLEIINHTFNFFKKVSVNMELMQSNAAQMATYGIVIGIPQLTLTLLANIKTATKSDYGCEFCLAMHAIRKKYAYNHVHDATSLKTILMELAGADGVRALKDALAPNTMTGRSVANSISFLNTMMNNDTTTSKYTKSAYSASSNSGSLEEQHKSRKCKHKKTKKSKSWEKKKKEKCGTPSIGFAQWWRNATYSLGSAFNRMLKKINKNKHVRFTTSNKEHKYTYNEQPIMIIYDSRANRHYISEKDQRKAGLPILRPSTRKDGVANGGTSKAKYVTQLQFWQLSDQSRQADTFQDFPNSLMSVGKTANKGTVSVFTKDGINVFKEEDVLITCKGKLSSLELEIVIDNTKYRWCNNGDSGNRGVHPNKQGKHSDKPTASTISRQPNKPSNGCMPYVVNQ